jgi:glucose/mannose-6-phosphate isomerase
MNIDNKDLARQLDTGKMIDYVDALPDQLAEAWEHGHRQALDAAGSFRHVVICGMGGSSISGELFSALALPSCPASLSVNREYDLPAFAAGPETLVIALSHSGGTEETLSAARQALERDAKVLAITTGGALADLVTAGSGQVWRYSYASQPRAALGWLYGLLLAAADRFGLAGGLAAEVQQSVALLREGRASLGLDRPAHSNPAKQTAVRLAGRIPVIWGAGVLSPVARRWKTQLNENAKTAAYFEVLPELNHNAVVGLSFPDDLKRSVAVLQLISDDYDHPRVRVRQQASFELLVEEGIMVEQIRAQGQCRLAQQMYLIQMGDYISLYLATGNRVDPTPIDNIVRLKKRLAEM